jgi:hypothetical protein
MFRQSVTAIAVVLALGGAHAAHAQSLSPLQLTVSNSVSSSKAITVVPFEFDPYRTNLVRATWLTGTGCPTSADIVTLDVNGNPQASTFADTGCPSTDPKDHKFEGLLLSKIGPTENFAAAGAKLEGVKGMTITELGYDIRTGSHCGAGAPRFNVVTVGPTGPVNHFVGCSSPPAVHGGVSTGWKRLRWGAAELAMAFPPLLPTDVVDSITIIFDEGTDTAGGPDGPDSSGLAILDNIDINRQLVGRGPGSGN